MLDNKTHQVRKWCLLFSLPFKNQYISSISGRHKHKKAARLWLLVLLLFKLENNLVDQDGHSYEEGTTESTNRPVHSSPGFKVIGFSTAAPSMQSIFLYSSSPKSAMDLDFFSQGFQTPVCKHKPKCKI